MPIRRNLRIAASQNFSVPAGGISRLLLASKTTATNEAKVR
jgi:hypothetical protein